MTFLELIEQVLLSSNKPLKSKQIWEIAKTNGYDKSLPEPTWGARLTPWDTISARLSIDLRLDNTIFIRTSRGYFWLKDKVIDDEQLEQLEHDSETEYDKQIGITKIKEADLHKPLTKYLYDIHRMYTKTINANTVNSKSGQMKWGTPDIVGVSFVEYNTALHDFCLQTGISNLELQAFELKVKLDTINLIESFFQTVSNSSWAHEAWLVAMEIQDDEKFKSELERLNQSFGVGILQLDYKNPSDSQIIYHAKKRQYLDLDTMNKLMDNKDYNIFISHINDALNNKDKQKLHKRLEEKIQLKCFNDPK